ncbi:MAG: T9SS C-terminal target domain-containing protein, partial [Bacteroidetes bacterium]|nr:T9SS C-terminal target domain-containing protein [Bacteroidota bacterium]
IHSSCTTDTSKYNPTGCNGTANALGTGGVYPYTFSWSNGKTTSLINGLCQGTYTVTLTDAAGTTATRTTTIKLCH